jgi:hypothetical protein
LNGDPIDVRFVVCVVGVVGFALLRFRIVGVRLGVVRLGIVRLVGGRVFWLGGAGFRLRRQRRQLGFLWFGEAIFGHPGGDH